MLDDQRVLQGDRLSGFAETIDMNGYIIGVVRVELFRNHLLKRVLEKHYFEAVVSD